MTREQALWYLAGMIDGEGHVTGNHKRYREIQIANSENDLLEACEACCRILGYHFSRRKGLRCTIIAISQRSTLQKTLELPLQSDRKKDALMSLINSYAPHGVSRNCR